MIKDKYLKGKNKMSEKAIVIGRGPEAGGEFHLANI